jgi:hypothetical protein
VLLRTPNLRHLDVTTVSCNFDSETLARLRDSGPRIASLCILQDFTPSSAHNTRITHQLVAAFPSIRILEIIASLSLSLPPFDPPPNLSLVYFKIHTSVVRDVGPCLASLLNPNPEDGAPLQVLFHRSNSASALGDVLNMHGAHLRSLSVKSLDPEEASVALACPQLERFELQCFPDAATLALIPRSITALAVRGQPEHGQQDINRLEEAFETFPHLKTFTWSSYRLPELSVAFERVCRERGIELRTSAKDSVVRLEVSI